MKLPIIPWWLWLAYALVGVCMETIALLNAKQDDTLTQTTIRHLPGWVLAMVVGWLAWHVMVSYIGFWAGKHGR